MLFYSFILILLLSYHDMVNGVYTQHVHLYRDTESGSQSSSSTSGINYILIIVHPDAPGDPQCKGIFGDVKFPIHKIIDAPAYSEKGSDAQERCTQEFRECVGNLLNWVQHSRGMNSISISVTNMQVEELNPSLHVRNNKSPYYRTRLHPRNRFRRSVDDSRSGNYYANYDFDVLDDTEETADSGDTEIKRLNDIYLQITTPESETSATRTPTQTRRTSTIKKAVPLRKMDFRDGSLDFPVVLPQKLNSKSKTGNPDVVVDIEVTSKRGIVPLKEVDIQNDVLKPLGFLRKLKGKSKNGLDIYELVSGKIPENLLATDVKDDPRRREEPNIEDPDDEDWNSEKQDLIYRKTTTHCPTKTTKDYLFSSQKYDGFPDTFRVEFRDKAHNKSCGLSKPECDSQSKNEATPEQNQPSTRINYTITRTTQKAEIKTTTYSEYIPHFSTTEEKYEPIASNIGHQKMIPAHHNSLALLRTAARHQTHDTIYVDPETIISALKQQFYHTFLDSMDTNQASASPSLLSMVQNLLGQMETIQGPNGYFALIHGGKVSDLKNCSTDLVHTLHFIWNVCNPESTVVVLTAGCPSDGSALPLLVSGPDTEIFKEITELLDIPAMIREHIQKNCDGPNSSDDDRGKFNQPQTQREIGNHWGYKQSHEKVTQLFESFPNGDKFSRELAESLVAPSDVWYSDIKIDAELDKIAQEEEEKEEAEEDNVATFEHHMIKRSEAVVIGISHVCSIIFILTLFISTYDRRA